jgi:hypothetical protein
MGISRSCWTAARRITVFSLAMGFDAAGRASSTSWSRTAVALLATDAVRLLAGLLRRCRLAHAAAVTDHERA